MMEYWKNGKVLNARLQLWEDGNEGEEPRIHSDINHARARHSRESGNPEKHWIPDQVRNDKPIKTHVVVHISHLNPIFHYSNIPIFLLVPYMEV